MFEEYGFSDFFMSLQNNIGKAIRALRSQKGVSQEKLALETGVGRRYMSDIENGRRNVSLEIIEKLANFFELSPSDFVKQIENAKTELSLFKYSELNRIFPQDHIPFYQIEEYVKKLKENEQK